MPRPARTGSALVNTGPLFRLVKVEIISSYLEKEFFLLVLSPRTCLRSDQDTGRKEISVSSGLTRVQGRRKNCSVYACLC